MFDEYVTERQIQRISYRGVAALAGRCALRAQDVLLGNAFDSVLLREASESINLALRFASGDAAQSPAPHPNDTGFFPRVMQVAQTEGAYDAAVAAIHAGALVEIACNTAVQNEAESHQSESGVELGHYDLNLIVRTTISAIHAVRGDRGAALAEASVFLDYGRLILVAGRQPKNWLGEGIDVGDTDDLGPLWNAGAPDVNAAEGSGHRELLISDASATGDKTGSVEVFYSYSHQDEVLRNELESHLSVLKRQGVVKTWHDRRIQPGDGWKGKIDEHVDKADLVLLLVSADFLASDYCYDVEMSRALARHEFGNTRVVPVIVRPCDWHYAPFGTLQALPKDGVAVTSWNNRDEAFKDVAVALRKVIFRIVKMTQ